MSTTNFGATDCIEQGRFKYLNCIIRALFPYDGASYLPPSVLRTFAADVFRFAGIALNVRFTRENNEHALFHHPPRPVPVDSRSSMHIISSFAGLHPGRESNFNFPPSSATAKANQNKRNLKNCGPFDLVFARKRV